MFVSEEPLREETSGLSEKNPGSMKKGESSKVDTKGLSLEDKVVPKAQKMLRS